MASSLSDILSTIQNGVIALNNLGVKLNAALFRQSGTGAVTRTFNSKLRDIVSVKDFGAVCDGVTDDTAAVQRALNTGRLVVLPTGTTKITSDLIINIPGTGLVGSGMFSTFITSSSTTLPMIFVASTVGYINISNLCLKRSVVAVSGADGIAFAGGNQICYLDRMWIQDQYNGLSLSATTISYASNIVCNANVANGLLMTNTAVIPGFQWVLDNILSQLNGERGFLIASTAGPATTNSCGQLTRLFSFGNTNEGFYVAGTAAEPIAGIRLSDSFFGGDGSHEVLMDSYSGEHIFTNVFTELAGTGLTGPLHATAASNVGAGFFYTANNVDIEMVNCRADHHSEWGVRSFATRLGIIGGSITDCAFNGTPKPGISLGGASNNRIVGVYSGGVTQNYGLAFAAVAVNVLYDNCDLSGNGTGTVFNASVGTVRVGQILP